MRAVRALSLAWRATALAVVVARVARAARPLPPVAPASGPPPGSLAVVVPARDEARRIGPLLDAVIGAPHVDEVVVVDDGSTDATAEIAVAAGARIVTPGPLPPGWTGKAWALQRGIEAVDTDWVVTLDADTRPDPLLPASLVDRAAADRLDLLTVAGRFESPTRALRWLHPAMLTTLVYRYGPVGAAARSARRLLANGQCTVVPRASFLARCGFAPVAGHTVEDVALARSVAASGGRVAFLDASSLLRVRMYESFADAWRGWGRSLALPDVEPPARQAIDVATLLAAQVLPLWRVVTGRADVVDVVALAVRLGTLAGTARAYDGAGPAYWASPLADPLAVAAVAKGAVSRRRAWRGRTYAARPTPPARSAPR